MNRQNRLLQALILSLILHFLIGSTASVLFPKFASAPPPHVSTVELLEEKPQKLTAKERKAQQMVRAAKLPKEMLDPDKQVSHRYLSEDKQTVLEETRAAESGMTTNRTQQSKKENQRRAAHELQVAHERQVQKMMTVDPIKQVANKQAHINSYSGGDIGVAGLEKQRRMTSAEPQPKPESKPFPLPNFAGIPLEHGFSTTGERLPDSMKIGRFTALNTDRYLYYAFYARAEELFRPHWETYVRAAMFTYQQAHKAQGNELWNSRVEILLDPKGRFVKGILRESSGVHSLDLAPVQAFQDAQRIPNPPPEMVSKDDGMIHMDYEFTVEMGPQLAAGN